MQQPSRPSITNTENGNLDAAKTAMKANANDEIDTRLCLAASNGEIEIVRHLLAEGGDVHVHFEGALLNAAANGHVEIVRLLLSAGADPRADGSGALRYAVSYNQAKAAELLIAAGADVHVDHDAPLRQAAWLNRIALMRILLAAGADPVIAWRSNKQAYLRREIAERLSTCADVMTPEQRNALAALSEDFAKLRAIVASSGKRTHLQR